MTKTFLTFLALLAAASATAETILLYQAPTSQSPVVGAIDSNSSEFKKAQVVADAEGWKEVPFEGFFSGFVAQDSITPDGGIEVGTTVLMTPSKGGRVLTTIQKGDDVSVNLVDRWTEITVSKQIIAYFRAEQPPASPSTRSADAPPSRIRHAEDPLLSRMNRTSFTPTPGAASTGTGLSRAEANQGMAPVAETMTGFENVDSMNPAIGSARSSRAVNTESLASTDGPAGLTAAERSRLTASTTTMTERSMGSPLSLANVDAATIAPPPPTEGPAEMVENEIATQAIESTGPAEPSIELTEPTVGPFVDLAPEDEIIPLAPVITPSTGIIPEPTPTTPEAGTDLPEPDDAAMGVEGVTETEMEVVPETEVEVIPVVPMPREPEATIVDANTGEEVEVNVEEARLPGITETMPEEEVRLIPPSDTNRLFVGKIKRTSKFLGIGPDYEFELINFQGKRIGFVDLSRIPLSNFEKFNEKIVQVYGELAQANDGKTILIRAANLTLR